MFCTTGNIKAVLLRPQRAAQVFMPILKGTTMFVWKPKPKIQTYTGGKGWITVARIGVSAKLQNISGICTRLKPCMQSSFKIKNNIIAT